MKRELGMFLGMVYGGFKQFMGDISYGFNGFHHPNLDHSTIGGGSRCSHQSMWLIAWLTSGIFVAWFYVGGVSPH